MSFPDSEGICVCMPANETKYFKEINLKKTVLMFSEKKNNFISGFIL
jgi:hypothetical protein